MLGRSSSGIYPIRLAGGFVADLHGRDLRGHNGLSLFRLRDRSELHSALEASRRRPEPLVAAVEVFTDGPSLPMEVLFAPLIGDDAQSDRYLGLYQPLSPVSRLMGRTARDIAIQSIHGAWSADEELPRLRLATLDGRRIA